MENHELSTERKKNKSSEEFCVARSALTHEQAKH